MRAVSFVEANEHLAATLERVAADGEPVMISGPGGCAFVVMTRDQFAGWDETAFVTSTPEDVGLLRESIAQLEAGRGAKHELIEPSDP